ncbi:HIT family protein [Rothia uropygialis]|uniref:HIT family protein n=1 Tax=Kocuria sp. 36 TaxID=1415402 RepID=UPI00101D1D9B|nr:HIT family protein [Kocuria sp. 36]
MSTVFTKIIEGELPARFVWKDERAVGFLSIAPLSMGHVLVVPREEVDHWVDLPQDLSVHLMKVCQTIGQAIDEVYDPVRVGLMIQGFEVPHAHLHVWPTNSIEEFSFDQVDNDPDQDSMDEAAAAIRDVLTRSGHFEAEVS